MAVLYFRTLLLVVAWCTAFSSSLVLVEKDPTTKNLLTIPGSSSGYNICQPSNYVESGHNRCTLTWVSHSNVKDSARIFVFDHDCRTINAPTRVTSSELNAGYAATSELPNTVVLFLFDPARPTESMFKYGAKDYKAAFSTPESPGMYNEFITLAGFDLDTNGEGIYQISRNQFQC